MKLTDDLTKKLAKAVETVLQSSEKEGVRSGTEHEFVKIHTDNVSVVDLTPDEKPFQDPSKLKESTKLNEAAPVKSSDWIEQLGNVVARASDTKDLNLAFEAWANSLYKTPAWEALMRNPMTSNLINTLAEALDVYIGYSAEESAKKFNGEDSQIEEASDKVNTHIKIDGKVWAKDGKALKFSSKNAKEVADKIKVKSPSAKIELVTEEVNPLAGLEKEWKSSPDKKSLIKKHDLVPAISSIRPGELKLGIRNQLNGKRTFPALDDKGNLIIISGTSASPKIRYVKESGVVEESTELDEASVKWVDPKTEKNKIVSQYGSKIFDAIPIGAKVYVEWNDEIPSFVAYNDFKGGVHAVTQEPGGQPEWTSFKDLKTARDTFYDFA